MKEGDCVISSSPLKMKGYGRAKSSQDEGAEPKQRLLS
jgi:hypothetical protein